MISSFARNWKRSEPEDGKLGLTNGIDGRQNGIKFSKDCWKPSKAREDMGERGPRHPLPTPVRPNLKQERRRRALHARPTTPVHPHLFLSKERVRERLSWTIRRSRNPRSRTRQNEFN